MSNVDYEMVIVDPQATFPHINCDQMRPAMGNSRLFQNTSENYDIQQIVLRHVSFLKETAVV